MNPAIPTAIVRSDKLGGRPKIERLQFLPALLPLCPDSLHTIGVREAHRTLKANGWPVRCVSTMQKILRDLARSGHLILTSNGRYYAAPKAELDIEEL